MRAFRRLVVLAAVALLAGRGTEPGSRSGDGVGAPPDVPSGPLEVHDQWTACDVDRPYPPVDHSEEIPLQLPRLGMDFVAVAAIVCTVGEERRPAGWTVLMALEQRADDITALVAALRLPDQPRTDGPCAAAVFGIEWLALLDARGRWVRPGTPADSCSSVRIEVRDALRQVKRSTVRSRIAGEISREAAVPGCGMPYDDIIAMQISRPFSEQYRRLGALPFADAKHVRLCVYAITQNTKPGVRRQATEFEYGLVLPDERRGAIERALLAAGPGGNCSQMATRSAMLSSVNTGGEVYVELDGCRRILATPTSGGKPIAQGDAALAALLGKE